MILRSMQSFNKGVTVSRLDSNLFLIFEEARRRNSKQPKSMVGSGSRTYAPGYGDLTLGDAELEEVRNLRILEKTFDSNLTFDTHLRAVVSKAARNLGVVRL